MLGAAQQYVARYRALHPRLETSMLIEEYEALTIVGEPVHERWRDQHVAEDDDSAEMVERYAQLRFPFDFDPYRIVVEMQVCPLRSDVERVEERLHGHASGSNRLLASVACRSLAASAAGWQISRREHSVQRLSLTGAGRVPASSAARTSAMHRSTIWRN